MSRPGCDASSPLIGFIGSIVVFSLVFATVVEMSISDGQQKGQVDDANYSALATNLASLILSTPGRGWYQSGACSNGVLDAAKMTPDGLQQFALGEEPCGVTASQAGSVNNLSYAKLQTLIGAQALPVFDNKLVDYEEARNSLKLETLGLNFHLRTWPVVPAVAQVLGSGYQDPHMKPLYIGHYDRQVSGGGGTRMVQHVKGLVDGADKATPYVNITNNGTAPTIFGVVFKLQLKSGNIDFTLHTKLLDPGQSHNVTFELRKTNDWLWNDPAKKWIDYEITDKDGGFQQGTIDMASITMTSASLRANLFAESDKLYFKLGQSPNVETKFHYASYDGEGKPKNFDDWTYKLVNPAGATIATFILPNKDKGFEKYTASATGAYTARLENDALTALWNWDVVNVIADDPSPFTTGGTTTYVPATSVAPEARFVDYLVGNFQANVFSNTYNHTNLLYAAGGDVFPDVKTVLDNDFPAALTDGNGNPTLAKYTTLVVGANVDHNAMTSQAAKGTIRDWVQAGGTLIATGSDDQSVTWLQPLFHAALDSGSGGISTPDPNHPLLKTPNALDYNAYLTHSTVWHFNQADDAEHFTHVIMQGADDILAISDPGEFGKGRILLTSWQAYDMMSGAETGCDPVTATCPGLSVLHNFLTLSYHGLYIDYGPKTPVNQQAGAQARILTAYHPELQSAVEIGVLLYVFD